MQVELCRGVPHFLFPVNVTTEGKKVLFIKVFFCDEAPCPAGEGQQYWIIGKWDNADSCVLSLKL